ncbi:hypothetical protein SK128_005654 [Halocaridina rubra]|uniref:Peptidase M14 domain-containing protein n=1 Tax=Halocaridina rubra TaxID=373956 RepID=A0AAN8ZYI8_HALRR
MHLGKPCNSPTVQFPDGITNGAKWYSVSGGMQDWNYLHTNCFEITVEISCNKYPVSSELPIYWMENKQPLLAYMEQVHTGVKGFIFDENQNPISNATISVQGINHDVISAAEGDYWRLLVPGTYVITVFADGYEPNSQKIEVPHLWASEVNFTMKLDDSSTWSQREDFDIAENLRNKYLTNSELNSAMADLENQYKEVAEFLANDNDWSMKIHALKITDDSAKNADNRLRVVVFGGLYGAQPVGRELILRLGRHLGAGWAKKDPKIKSLLETTSIYLVPAVDVQGFEKSVPGMCGYSDVSEIQKEVGGLFSSEISDLYAQATVTMLEQIQPHVAISLESGGLFMRFPWDDPSASPPTTPDESSFQFLTETYARIHPTMLKKNTCATYNKASPTGILHGQAIGVYKNSLLDYTYKNLHNTLMIAAHVSCCNYPPGRTLKTLWRENKEALVTFLQAAHQGNIARIHTATHTNSSIIEVESGLNSQTIPLLFLSKNVSASSSANNTLFVKDNASSNSDQNNVHIEMPVTPIANIKDENLPVVNYVPIPLNFLPAKSNHSKVTEMETEQMTENSDRNFVPIPLSFINTAQSQDNDRIDQIAQSITGITSNKVNPAIVIPLDILSLILHSKKEDSSNDGNAMLIS